MTKKISLGKYIPGDSLIHKLDSRTKIIISSLLSFAVFCTQKISSLLLILIFGILMMKISKIPFKRFIKSNAIMLLISIFTTLINLFFEAQSKFLTTGIFYVTSKNIKNSSCACLRLVSLIFINSVMMFTTSSNSISSSIEKILKPLDKIGVCSRDIALTLTITLRFIPTLFEELEKINSAQKARGASFKNKNLFKNIKTFSAVLGPVFIFSMKRSEELAEALESRGYDGSSSHTSFHSFKFEINDIIALLLTLLMIIGVIICQTLMTI